MPLLSACLFYRFAGFALHRSAHSAEQPQEFAILCLRFWDFLVVLSGPRSALSVRLTVPIVLLSVCLQRFMCLTELLLGVYYWQQ